MTQTGTIEPTDYERLLLVYLHDPLDKALDIRGHEARAARYASCARGWSATRATIKHEAQLADQLAARAERIPMPAAGSKGTCAVGLENECIEVRHPVSAQSAELTGLALNEDRMIGIINSIVGDLPDAPRPRFLALWRLLPAKLGPQLARLPADTRVPDHTLIQHTDITSGLWASHQTVHGSALLSLSLGPVQTFIEAARSVRDLWTGSAILSWLTFQGLRPLLAALGPTALVYPALRGHPLMDLWLREQGLEQVVPLPSKQALQSPSIPNRFVALVPSTQAQKLADACIQSVEQAWRGLADDVKKSLDLKLSSLEPGWAQHWQEQVNSFFDIQTSILHERDLGDAELAHLIGGHGSFEAVWPEAHKVRQLANAIPKAEQPGYDQGSAGRWQAQLEASARLMEAQRSIRHVPATPIASPSPPKCSLLGSYEQMGPPDLADSRQFWEKAADRLKLHGVRLRPGERFSAIALCKRFAAPAFLARELRLEPADLRFPDTATLAAAQWLAEADINPDAVRSEYGDWNGRWLHQNTRDDVDEGDQEPPLPIWQKIKKAKEPENVGAPPVYYAILMMDADEMSRWLRGDNAPQVREVLHPKMVRYFEGLGSQGVGDDLDAKRPVGPALHASISEALNNFASRVAPKIVQDQQDHYGTTIYSGGDDVLALLPMRQAVACAVALRRAFRGEEDTPGVPRGWIERDGQHLLTMGHKATLSAGIAFVHYKEDLRLALQAARGAEKTAKSSGRNQLALRFMRHAGSHDEALVPWAWTPQFQCLVETFASGATDRWAYRLRAELPTLQADALPVAAVNAEIRRLVTRTVDNPSDSSSPSGQEVENWWKEFYTAGSKRGRTHSELLEAFTCLCQGASFAARGRDA